MKTKLYKSLYHSKNTLLTKLTVAINVDRVLDATVNALCISEATHRSRTVQLAGGRWCQGAAAAHLLRTTSVASKEVSLALHTQTNSMSYSKYYAQKHLSLDVHKTVSLIWFRIVYLYL